MCLVATRPSVPQVCRLFHQCNREKALTGSDLVVTDGWNHRKVPSLECVQDGASEPSIYRNPRLPYPSDWRVGFNDTAFVDEPYMYCGQRGNDQEIRSSSNTRKTRLQRALKHALLRSKRAAFPARIRRCRETPLARFLIHTSEFSRSLSRATAPSTTSKS